MRVATGTMAWPRHRVGQALAALPCQFGGEAFAGTTPSPDGSPFKLWLERSVFPMGLEVEEVSAPIGELGAVVRRVGPCLIELAQSSSYLVVLSSGIWTTLHTPSGKVRVRSRALAAELGFDHRQRHLPGVAALIQRIGIRGTRRERARHALVTEAASDEQREGIYVLRARPAGPLPVDAGGLIGRAAALLLGYIAFHASVVTSWWIVGAGALGGTFDWAWLAAWCLTLATTSVVVTIIAWLEGSISIEFGSWLRSRLLHGALSLDKADLCAQGLGRLMGRVFESENLERLSLSGATALLSSVIELAAGIFVISRGAAPLSQLGALLGVLGLLGVLSHKHLKATRRNVERRLNLSNLVIEEMTGHRTRMVQQDEAQWHADDDRHTAAYMDASKARDRSSIWITTAVPRIWIGLATLSLLPAVLGGVADPAAFAVSIGAVLLVREALRHWAAGADQMGTAIVAWHSVRDFLHASRRQEPAGDPQAGVDSGEQRQPLVELRDVRFGYPGRAPVLAGASLTVRRGDLIRLEGASGSGKSTVASILSGLRHPDTGLVCAGGLDWQTHGRSGWKRWVAAAPQFHENHVFLGSFAYNLLLGRSWPPSPEDLKLASEVCRELGLDELLDKMPAGMGQPVGEIGWRLSHGERSRLFIARALLQGAPVAVLDESFGALDPETLQRSVACVTRRADAVVAIAHP